jgi:transposase
LILSETLDEAIERVSREIEQRLDPPAGPTRAGAQAPEEDQHQPTERSAAERTGQDTQPLSWAQAIVLLCSIPGISRRTAEGVLAEIGMEMSRLPTSGHLASWAGMCPGNHESAGKRLSGRTRKGRPWLRKLLVEAAHAAAHTKHTSLSALYQRIKARRGAKQAMIAVGHAILVICYHVLDQQVCSEELGGNYFDEHDRQATEKRLVRRLEKLGYHVELQPASQVA